MHKSKTELQIPLSKRYISGTHNAARTKTSPLKTTLKFIIRYLSTCFQL